MGRMRQADTGGLYEGVLERLSLALAAAEREGTEPLELEVQGLSDGELAFIHAYLQRDARWLSGWHAAAHEQARLSRRGSREQRRQQAGERLGEVGPSLSLTLDCALCTAKVHWPRQSGVVICSRCGSHLMKAFGGQGEATG